MLHHIAVWGPMVPYGGDALYPKGFALCRQPLLVPQDQSERVDFEILVILPL